MTQSTNNDVAIIGLSCRVAGANSPSELWDNLVSSKDVQSEITRFNTKGYYHPEGGPRKGLTNVRKAYMLDDEAIDKFDHAFFHVTPPEAAAMDPQQRMLLEIAYETIENAGITLKDFSGTDTAVFAGIEGCDYHSIASRDLDATPRYLATGTPNCMAANRLSYFFDLSGPSVSVDTACSSSMAALHLAVRTLQHGDSRMALVCSAKLILNPDMFIPSSELGFLSPSGKCQTFDEAADGYGRGEGVLALLLKPLNLAIADHDPIRAFVKGTRLNQDGKTQGITLPSADAQQRNMKALYQELDLDPVDIQYLEAHGTGTAAGDPLEFSAINAVFGHPHQAISPLIVGSVKGNIGHLEASSALASISKVTMCLERGLITPQMHYRNPNPKIDYRNVTIPSHVMSWKPERAIRTAAVNTFGAGGTNGHAVLESFTRDPPRQTRLEKRPFIFKVSAADETSLRRISSRYAEYIERCRPDIRDLAFTLLSRRSTLRHSIFFVSRNHEEFVRALRSDAPIMLTNSNQSSKKVIYLFTGQGAQWPEMGKSLIHESPLFEAILRRCDRYLLELPERPHWSIIDEILKPKDTSNIYKAEYSQPLCTAFQLGLVELLKSWGLNADGVIGHSSGEIAAAYTSGRTSMRDAIVTSYYRGLVLGTAALNAVGAMCVVGLGEHEANSLVEKYEGQVQIAAINSATSCTLSGDRDAVEKIIEELAMKKRFCRELRVDRAYHSHHMLSLASQYEQKLSLAGVGFQSSTSQCQMFSSVTGLKAELQEFNPSYWVRNMTSTVKFSAAVEQCMEESSGATAFVELGPHPALKGPALEVLQALGRGNTDYFQSCSRGEDDFESLLGSVATMIAADIPLDTAKVNAREVVDGLHCHHEVGNVLSDVPSYQWNHSKGFWTESRVSRNVRFRRFPRHELLGSRYVDDMPAHPSWRNQLMLNEISWLQELKASGASEMPSAVYILMALEAGRQLSILNKLDSPVLTLRNVQFHKPLLMSCFSDSHATLEVQLVSRQKCDEPEAYSFDIFSASSGTEDSWMRHCSGEFGWPRVVGPLLSGWSVVEHDQNVLNVARELFLDDVSHISDLKLSKSGSCGTLNRGPNKLGHYAFDPLVLEPILTLPPASLSRQKLPARYRLSKIASMTVSTQKYETTEGNFAVDIESAHHYTVVSKIHISQGGCSSLLEGVEHEAYELITHQPLTSSLFFQPIILPDITKVSKPWALTLSALVRLVMHKWPISDVVIGAMPEDKLIDLLRAFGMLTSVARSCCHSFQCLAKPFDGVREGVKFVTNLDSVAAGHILFAQEIPPSAQVLENLHPGGLICTPHEVDELRRSFEIAGTITDLAPEPWSLWRKIIHSPKPIQGRTAMLFASSLVLQPKPHFADVESISLEPLSIANFCKRKVDVFDAIVVDSPDGSLITAWPGKTLMPWLHILLRCAESLLWVSPPSTRNPSTDVAGSLLRTLQSEKPSMKVQWLILNDLLGASGSCFWGRVEQAYRDMLGGENELLVQSDVDTTKILRYYPDHELSANVGLTPPRISEVQLESRDYFVDFATPGNPVIMSSLIDSGESPKGVIEGVQVEASVLDIEDFYLFNGEALRQSCQHRGGTFFAGHVLISTGTGIVPERRVVGWHPRNAHRKKFGWLPTCCDIENKNLTAAEAASAYAATAIACCIIDGIARARPKETVSVDFEGPLEEAIDEVCAQIGAVMTKPSARSKDDFSVTFDDLAGVLVNGREAHIGEYLESDHGMNMVRHMWRKRSHNPHLLRTFGLGDLREAFRSVQPTCSGVLLHQDSSSILNHVPVYSGPPRLFSEDSEYVVVGGLGGLGRYICSWMVENGARHILIISRSGLRSTEAREAVDALKASGASIKIGKADACDRQIISKILATSRATRLIKGVINLAMLLDDAPMAMMTGEGWDRAVRVKVDSSWILHEETLRDSLDFFILFSSIASVLGNRNQGNYNVANSFLNALAEYRQSHDLPGISIALGAMTDIGVLHELSKPGILPVLSRSGLTHLTKEHLAKIMEAAIHESPRRDRSLIVTGLEMFEREADGSLVGRSEPLYWTELPEFGHLQRSKLVDVAYEGDERECYVPLKEQLAQLIGEGRIEVLRDAMRTAFLAFLSPLLGFGADLFDLQQSLAIYGVDSLNGVACQYWFHRELEVDVSVDKILGSASIADLVQHAVNAFTKKPGPSSGA